MTTKQMLMMFGGGVVVMAAAVLFAELTKDPNLPNDANIGAGLIFMIGIILIIIGIVGRIIGFFTNKDLEK